MVTFVSLFIGLIIGTHSVEISVGESVAAVDVRLDGERVKTLGGPPWRLDCDFGRELEPHELVAVAYDRQGREVGRTRQWINLPRALAESQLMLESDAGGQARYARLVWQSMEGGDPRALRVAFDGVPLQVDDPSRFALPDYDPRQLHMLQAELDFSVHVQARAELAIGGRFATSVTTELTAVPLRRARRRAARTPEELAGKLVLGEEPLDVVALEEDGAEILAVLERGANLGLGRLSLQYRNQTFPDTFLDLTENERVRFMFAQADLREGEAMRFDVLPMSQPFTAEDGRLEYLFTHVKSPETDIPQRVADAVAIAAVQAAASNRPRVVVLILGDEWEDASMFRVEEVKSFLAELRVPLLVWSAGQAGVSQRSRDSRAFTHKTPWGKAKDISSLFRLVEAIDEMRDVLGSQVIAWVEGSHLPQEVRLAGEVKGLELVR